MTQQTPTMLRIRELVLRGTLRPGERVRETDIADRLGISRTPVRQALPALAKEGLLVQWGARGYAVRSFSLQESLDALRIRACLEGLAARSLAESDARDSAIFLLVDLLSEGDALLRADTLTAEVELLYADMNERFHDTVVRSSEKQLLVELIARCNVTPFTGPGNIAFEGADMVQSMAHLAYAHRQHHAIVDALRAGDGGRVEFLFREHATIQESSLKMQPRGL